MIYGKYNQNIEDTTMGKYYDRLVKMNERLDAELHAKGIDVSKFNRVDNTNNASKNGENEVVLEKDGTDTIEIPPDSLTDEQKKKILLDKGVDKETVDGMKDTKEIDAALATSLNTDETNESIDGDVSEEVVIRMDDDDLEMHGYVSTMGGKELMLTDKIEDAQVFQHEELGQSRIEAICHKFHYDPSTFKTVSLDPRADEPYEDDNEVNIDDGEAWVSLDPMDSRATTINA